MLFIQSYFLQTSPLFYYIVATLGAIPIFYQFYIILKGIWKIIFRKKLNLIQIYGEKSWVLITGSSQGIGKQFALQFARQGFNIILLARTQSKLKLVKQQIESKYAGVKVQIVIADLIKQGQKQNIDDVLKELNSFKDISIVVNNAGIDVLDKYTDQRVKKIIDLININCFALGAINYKFIPYFEKRMKESSKKCGFINVGSVAGQMPMPLHNVYSASKGYVNHLTSNLSKEFPQITWQLLKPAEVSTAMTCFKDDITSVSVTQCVEGTLRDFGHQMKTNGALWHKIQSYIYGIIPSFIFNFIWTKVVAKQFIEQRREFQSKKKV